MNGVARSASLIKAVKHVCSKIHKLNMDNANKIELVFLELGIKQYGFDRFAEAVKNENERRYNEVNITGASQWCEHTRAYLEKTGFGNIYYANAYFEPEPEKVLLPEELAQRFGRFFVAQRECKLKAKNDILVEPVIRARKLNPDDFKPHGRYEALILLRMRETIELLRTKRLSCTELIQSVKAYFPEFFAVAPDLARSR